MICQLSRSANQYLARPCAWVVVVRFWQYGRVALLCSRLKFRWVYCLSSVESWFIHGVRSERLKQRLVKMVFVSVRRRAARYIQAPRSAKTWKQTSVVKMPANGENATPPLTSSMNTTTTFSCNVSLPPKLEIRCVNLSKEWKQWWQV